MRAFRLSQLGRVVRHAMACAAVLSCLVAWADEPLSLHPDNPHYFLFRGKSALLITSGEHYGAVLNRDFDFARYLDTLAADGLNLTRTFSGVYREIGSSFGIVDNTLAPADDRFLAPWARTDVPGTAANGHKFDLSRWNPEYFDRLKEFAAAAAKRGVVIEFVLFCAIYDDGLWAVNPLNPANNVNELPPLTREQVYTLKDPKLTQFEDALVQKIAAELGEFDNLYYEICNEPYFGGVSSQWNEHMIETLRAAEARLPKRHLIAQNIANGTAEVKQPAAGVSILNFHYATPPDAVPQNYGLNLAIGDDETGFRGTADPAYRTEAWEFILAGGAVFDSLDYSFSLAHPDGTQPITTSPGGGGPAFRKQLSILKKFIEGFDFVHLAPAPDAVRGGVPDKGGVRVLGQAAKQYAVYVRGGSQAKLSLELAAGAYRAEWIDTRSGDVLARSQFEHSGGPRELESPAYTEDIALRILAAQ